MVKEKVLIVGGGFAGVKTALELSEDDRFNITILSNRDNFSYYPSLYHVATGGKRVNASIPLKSILSTHNVKIEQGEALNIDRKAKTIETTSGETFSYDTLVLALGVVTNYFNIPGLAELSFGVKSIEDVEKLKAHLHRQLIDEKKPDLNYVIVGGGPTGIELAGALPSYIKYLMNLHQIEYRQLHVDLIEAESRLLPQMPIDTSRLIKRRLKKLGVRIYLGKPVQGETANQLMLGDKPIQSHTVIWTAGTAINPFYAANNFVLTPNHKVATDIYLQAEKNIFVLGDNANTPFSGLAQTAIFDGKYLANNLKRRASGKEFKSYYVHSPISVIPVGKNWAAVVWGKLRAYGMLGWLLRQAADAMAFHDFEPWVQAGRQWLTYFGSEETCRICLEKLPSSETYN